jgi:hypothetical protein
MSGTNPTPPPPALGSPEPMWAKPAVSIYALSIFLIAFGIAYMAKDSTSLTMLMGAAISMGTQVVQYYLGSSSGSAQKTAMLGTQPPETITTVTPTTVTTMGTTK